MAIWKLIGDCVAWLQATDVTRLEIFSALNGCRKEMAAFDNLLVYQTGHGWLDIAKPNKAGP